MKKICSAICMILVLLLQGACSYLIGPSSPKTWAGAGWHDAGFHPSGDSDAVVNLAATNNYLLAMTIKGKIYSSPLGSGKWNEIVRPFIRTSEYGQPGSFAVIGDKIYAKFLWTAQNRSPLDSSLWIIDPAQRTIHPIALPDSSLWCPDTASKPCSVEAVYNWNEKLVIGVHNEKGYHPDSNQNIAKTYVFISSDLGQTWSSTQNYTIPFDTNNRQLNSRYESDIYGFVNTSQGLYSQTWTTGMLKLTGSTWDTVPLIKSHIDSTPLKENPGFIVLKDTIYIANYWAEFAALSPQGQWKRLPDLMANSILDTACGFLFMSNQLMRWDPIAQREINIVDSSETRVKIDLPNAIPNGRFAYKLLRVGDSLYFGNGLGDSQSHGGIYVLNLREMPWCTEAWNRRDTSIVKAK